MRVWAVWWFVVIASVYVFALGVWLGVILRTRYLRSHARLLPPCEHPEWKTIGPGEWVCSNLACRKHRSGGYPK